MQISTLTLLPSHPNRPLRLRKITPRHHHLDNTHIHSSLQHILQIFAVDLFPTVYPAENGVREVDADLIGKKRGRRG